MRFAEVWEKERRKGMTSRKTKGTERRQKERSNYKKRG